MGLFDFILKPIQSIFGEVLGFLTGADFDDQDQASGVLVNKQSNIDPIPVIYGRRKVGGTRVFLSTGGNKNEYLYMVVVLSEGYIDAIEEVYINDELSIKNSSIVSGSKYDGLIGFGFALGTDQQSYIPLLAGADASWTSEHRLLGVAYVALRLKWDQDKFSGIPDIKCLVRGKRLYDPRKDSTSSVYDSSLGVSTHREGNVGTHEFSTNPALCLRDYLRNERYGKGLSASLIDDQSFADAADFLDATETSHTEAITVDGGFASGSTSISLSGGFTWLPAGGFLQFAGDSNLYEILTAQYGAGNVTIEAIVNALTNGTSVTLKQKIYECNAVIDTGKKLFDNVKEMLQGMRGLMPFSNGVYSLVIDKDESSTFDLTPSNITSEITVQTQGKNKKYNRVTVKFVNPDANWQSDSVTYPEAGSADETTFLSEDNGEVLAKTVTFNTIANKYSAKDIAKIICLASRKHEFTCKVRATSEALEIAVADIVTLDHPSFGWTGAAKKKFRVIAMQLVDTGEVDLTLQEYDNSIYPWVPEDEIDSGIDTVLPDPFEVAAPTGLNVAESKVIAEDGTVTVGLFATWTASDDSFVGQYEVELNNTTKNKKTNFMTSETEIEMSPVIIGDSYRVRVRAINSLGVRSDYTSYYVFGTATGDNQAPGVPTNLTANGGYKQITVSWVNPTDSDLKHVEIQVWNGSAWEDLAVVSGEVFVHFVNSFGTTKYYRVRAVDFSGNASAYTSSSAPAETDFVDNDAFDQGIINFFESQGAYPIENGSSLPTGYTSGDAGKLFFLTTNGKLYRWTGSTWTAAIVDLPDLSGQITTTQIEDDAITTPKITAGAITASEIAGTTITGDKIVANTITGGLLAASGVITQTAQINNGLITNAKIANLAVNAAKIQSLAVESLKIKGNAVTIPEGQTTVGTTTPLVPTVWTSGASVTVYWDTGTNDVVPEAWLANAYFNLPDNGSLSSIRRACNIRILIQGTFTYGGSWSLTGRGLATINPEERYPAVLISSTEYPTGANVASGITFTVQAMIEHPDGTGATGSERHKLKGTTGITVLGTKR